MNSDFTFNHQMMELFIMSLDIFLKYSSWSDDI